MVNQDVVLDLMRTDPTRKWTAKELADIIFKDRNLPRSFKTTSVFNALLKLEKWGDVKRTDMIPCNGHAMRGWVVM